MADRKIRFSDGQNQVDVKAIDNLDGTYNLGITAKEPTFSVSDSLTRPANTTPYAVNKSINCSVAVTALAYALKVVTLTAANAFAVGDRITVAGVNTGFTVTNVDGNWICGEGTNATTVVFTVAVQPTGTTPQTIAVGTIAKMLSLDIAGVAGGGVLLSRLKLCCQGVAMTGGMRIWIYNAQITALVDQATQTLLYANRAARLGYVDAYPITDGAGSDCTEAEIVVNREFKCAAGDTRLYFALAAEGAETPVSGGVITLLAEGLQMLG